MSTQVRNQIITKGLITYIDGNYQNSLISGSLLWKDIIRKNTDSSLINGASYTTEYGGGVNFDGVDDWVSIPYNYALTTEPFAVEIWRKHVSTSTSLPGILSCGNYLGSGAYGSPGWCIGYYNTAGTSIIGAIGDNTSFNRYVGFSNNALTYSPYNKPQHIFFHRNTNTETLSLFLNGNKASISFSNAITIGGGNRNYLGAYTWGYGQNTMFGALYAVKLYYNTNFTDEEILSCFNSTRERFGI